jgi:hypothetical protein
MTSSYFAQVNQRNLYNLLCAFDYKKIILTFIIPFLKLKSDSAGTASLVQCSCGWKGEEMKAHKHYLEVEGIAELELYCPKCGQYLCFISEPVIATL